MKLYLLLVLLLVACSKPVPPVPVQATPTPAPVSPTVVAPAAVPSTQELTKLLNDNDKVKVVKTKKKHNSLEAAAYAKAYRNARIANFLLGTHRYKESRKDTSNV